MPRELGTSFPALYVALFSACVVNFLSRIRRFRPVVTSRP